MAFESLTFVDPVADFPLGPGTLTPFTINGTFVAPSDHGVGATFINAAPAIGPAMPAIEYSNPVQPANDHMQGIANTFPPDNIYG